MSKILNFFKNKRNIVICSLVLIIALVVVLFLVFNKEKVTKLEKIKIEEYSDKYINYLSYVIEYPDNKLKYLNFALDYLSETTDKKEYTIDDITTLINEVFDITYNKKDIEQLLTIQNALKSGFKYDNKKETFSYVGEISRSDVAKREIVDYEITKITKINKTKFEVTYNRYIVSDPYLMYNYYNSLNTENEEEKKDIEDLVEYLKGNRKVKDIKKYISKDNIEKFGKIEKNIKYIYIIENDKLILKEKK